MTARYWLALAAWLAWPALAAGGVTARLPVVVYDGPAESSTPRYLLGKNYPVVVISETSGWLKVCLHDKTAGYMRRRDMVPGKNFVVVRDTAVRVNPSRDSPVNLRANARILLTSTGEAISGWLPVRHASGAAGFVPLADVWGHGGC